MLKKSAAWLSILRGAAMKKSMVGDTFVVVIDEVGEVTFQHDILPPCVAHISEHKTAERAVAAVLELIEVAEQIVGTGRVGQLLHGAKELLLVNFEFHVNRLIEQSEFQGSARKG